jgi:hypothetical protein
MDTYQMNLVKQVTASQQQDPKRTELEQLVKKQKPLGVETHHSTHHHHMCIRKTMQKAKADRLFLNGFQVDASSSLQHLHTFEMAQVFRSQGQVAYFENGSPMLRQHTQSQ